jgi:hypothetical protein
MLPFALQTDLAGSVYQELRQLVSEYKIHPILVNFTAALLPVTPLSSSIQNNQPAIAVKGVITAAKQSVHQPVSRSVCLARTLLRMSLKRDWPSTSGSAAL